MPGWRLPAAVPLVAVLLLVCPAVARAGPADVLGAKVECRPAPGGRPASVCRFSVTIRHDDTGWDHYANRYEICDLEGHVLATRVLRHPHVDEQPFTRGIGNVRIPSAVREVEIRAGDLVHGLGGATIRLAIPHAAPAPDAKAPASETRPPENAAPPAAGAAP